MASLGLEKIPFSVVFESKGPVINVMALENILDNWDIGGTKKPRLIDTLPTQNTLGLTQPQSKKHYMPKTAYLSLNIGGRVVRMETFSKLFYPGIRTGFVPARSELIQRLLKYSKISTKTLSGISQAMLLVTV